VLEQRIRSLLDEEIGVLRERIARAVADVAGVLPARHAQTLRHEHGRWAGAEEWRLINAADPCGT
jgi:hypothetical protein